MDTLNFDFDWRVMLACASCGSLFCSDSDPLAFELPNGWRLLVFDDLCPSCAARLAHDVVRRYEIASQELPPAPRR